MTVSQACLVFDDFDSFQKQWSEFVKCLSVGICLGFLHDLAGSYVFSEEEQRGEMPFSANSWVHTIYCLRGLSRSMLTLVPFLNECLVSFSTVKLLPSSLFRGSGRKSHVQPTVKE